MKKIIVACLGTKEVVASDSSSSLETKVEESLQSGECRWVSHVGARQGDALLGDDCCTSGLLL